MNSKLHKILVLLGVIKSPTMANVYLPEEYIDKIKHEKLEI